MTREERMVDLLLGCLYRVSHTCELSSTAARLRSPHTQGRPRDPQCVMGMHPCDNQGDTDPCAQRAQRGGREWSGSSSPELSSRPVLAGGRGGMTWRLSAPFPPCKHRVMNGSGSPGGTEGLVTFQVLSSLLFPEANLPDTCVSRGGGGVSGPAPFVFTSSHFTGASLSPVCSLTQFPSPRRGVPWAPRGGCCTCADETEGPMAGHKP